ncbi:hypothetical protein SOVF_091680 [Spinacia oleracea]|nr:hypothetical protein SOVF_091680 [Spinacia oleracea]
MVQAAKRSMVDELEFPQVPATYSQAMIDERRDTYMFFQAKTSYQ